MKFFALFLSQIVLSTFVFSQSEINLKANFSTDKSTLSDFELSNLKSHLDTLEKTQIIDITISAFCDDLGNEVYNQKLSTKRALHIKEILIDCGIEPVLISATKGKGELSLKQSATDIQTQRAINRKAEINITLASAKVPIIKEEYIVEEAPIETLVREPIVETPKNITSINDSLEIGDKMVLEGILFEGGTHKILIESIPVIQKLVVELKKYNQYHFIIQGHICCSSDNLDGVNFITGKRNLSEARAEAVYKYLITNGISKKRLKYKGLKNKFPLGKGDKFDRRVELKVSKIDES